MEQHIVVNLWGLVTDTVQASELLSQVLLARFNLAPVVHVYEVSSRLLELLLRGSQALVKLVVRIFVGHDRGSVHRAAPLTPLLSQGLAKGRGLLHARL